MIIFDANDIDYLVNHFPIEQLRQEIKTARNNLKGEIELNWQWYYEDLIKSCQLAIVIAQSYISKPKADEPTKRISIEDLKAKYDLTDYIGQYIPLRKSGNRYMGLCPFHPDKRTASFVVYPNQTYHCFGCQKHGDLISFVMEYEHIDIKDAINKLAR